MLLFIGLLLSLHNLNAMFQYISCYSLSVSPFVSANVLGRFNTSHVTLYLRKRFFNGIPDCVSIHLMLLFIPEDFLPVISSVKFQYISCYSLSFNAARDAVKSALFQYISCYSLSWTPVVSILVSISFNTSHVTLYRKIHLS